MGVNTEAVADSGQRLAGLIQSDRFVDLLVGESAAAQPDTCSLEDRRDGVAVEAVLVGQGEDRGTGLVVGNDAGELTGAELSDGLGERIPGWSGRVCGGWELDDQQL